MSNTIDEFSIVVLGATGAIGSETVKKLVDIAALKQITVLARRP